MKRHGFTLVELLVVVAMIAILAAMIVPVLLQAKEAAKMRTCAQNIRMIGIALTEYFDDNNGYGLPQSPRAFKNQWILWAEPLVKYIGVSATPFAYYKSPEGLGATSPYQNISINRRPDWVWVCPGDTNKGPKDPATPIAKGESYEPYWWYCGSSYLYPGPTAYMSGDTEQAAKTSKVLPRKPLTWKCHKRDIMLADMWFDFHSGQRVPHDFNSIQPSATVRIQDTRSINMLFLDMHLSAVTASQREEYLVFTIETDNPFFVKPDTKAL